jgi:thioredoxin 1
MVKFLEFVNSNELVLVDFHAEWCVPCKTLAPILKSVKNEFGSQLKIVKIDIDRNQRFSTKMKVKGVPTLVLFQKGKQVWRESGVMPKNQLSSLITKYTGT